MFLTRAAKIWREWQAALDELCALHEGKPTELCIVAIILPSLLSEFDRKLPETHLRITVLGSDRALKVLKDGLVDIAIVMAERHWLKEPHWVIQPLYRESVQILMASSHPLSKSQELTWVDLAQYPHVI